MVTTRIRTFSDFAAAVARAAGRPGTFAASLLLIAVWALTGPLFHYSDTWQLIINTGTTIVTFLMVFLIQNTQNRDGAAIQAKLDELIRASAAQNAYIGIENLTEEELDGLARPLRGAGAGLSPQRGRGRRRGGGQRQGRGGGPAGPRPDRAAASGAEPAGLLHLAPIIRASRRMSPIT